jgi:DNA-binding transcriptional regulator YdaS (Cro superfamily)
LILFSSYAFMPGMSNPSQALEKAIKAAGGLGGLAEPLGITAQAISQWEQVPPRRVLDVERLTGVPRHELRPDLYPEEREQAAQ